MNTFILKSSVNYPWCSVFTLNTHRKNIVYELRTGMNGVGNSSNDQRHYILIPPITDDGRRLFIKEVSSTTDTTDYDTVTP